MERGVNICINSYISTTGIKTDCPEGGHPSYRIAKTRTQNIDINIRSPSSGDSS